MASARILFLAAGTAAIGLAAALPAAAHHGWSTYTIDDFTLTGTVKEIRLGNPHDRLVVEAEGEDWDIWLSPPSRSRAAGFDEDAIKVGDTVVVNGDRRPDSVEVKTEKLTVNGVDYELYPERLASR